MTISEYLTSSKKSQTWLAKTLNVSVMTASRYVRGIGVIPAERAVQIEQITDGAVRRGELRADLFEVSAGSAA